MKTTRRSLATLLFSLLFLSTINAQTPRDTELPIDTLIPAKRPLTAASPVIVSATASSQRVRYIAAGEVHQTRLQVFSTNGTQVYDSDFRLGNLIDWQLADQQGQQLTAASYLFLITVRDFTGNLTQKYGTVQIEQEQVYLQQTGRDELTSAQAAALEANRQAEIVSVIDRIGAAGVNRSTVTASDGATVDAAPTGKSRSASKPGTSGENIAGTGTQNKIAKWIDNAGTLGDSNIFGDGAGNVGIGTPTPGGQLHIFGAATQDVFAGLGPDVISGPALNFGYAGSSFGRGAGFFNVRPDASATAPNPSLRFATGNVQRMIITNTGNVGIGTLSPQSLLDVAGDINTSTQYNIRGSRVLSTSGRMDFLETNVFAGVSAGANTTPGSPNILFSGVENSFFGFGAGSGNSSGSTNTFVGFTSGSGNTHGNNNTMIGATTFMDSGDLVNATAIGYNARVSLSNSLILGNGANVGIGTSAPQTKLQVAGGDVFIATQSNGLILRATDGGNCYRITVNNTGVLSATSVTCP